MGFTFDTAGVCSTFSLMAGLFMTSTVLTMGTLATTISAFASTDGVVTVGFEMMAKGALLTGLNPLALTGDGSASWADLADGAFLLGPRARPLVICVKSEPDCEVGSSPLVVDDGALNCEGAVSDDGPPRLAAKGEGPRASMPARPGLSLPATLVDTPARNADVVAGAGVPGLDTAPGNGPWEISGDEGVAGFCSMTAGTVGLGSCIDFGGVCLIDVGAGKVGFASMSGLVSSLIVLCLAKASGTSEV